MLLADMGAEVIKLENAEIRPLKQLANRLNIDGKRPPSLVAAPLGADNGTLLEASPR